jgi:transcription elongation factor GreA
MPKDVILTPQGLETLQRELDDLQTNKRREVAERIKEAREFGDISENSEYDDARRSRSSRSACARRRSSTPPTSRPTWSRSGSR